MLAGLDRRRGPPIRASGTPCRLEIVSRAAFVLRPMRATGARFSRQTGVGREVGRVIAFGVEMVLVIVDAREASHFIGATTHLTVRRKVDEGSDGCQTSRACRPNSRRACTHSSDVQRRELKPKFDYDRLRVSRRGLRPAIAISRVRIALGCPMICRESGAHRPSTTPQRGRPPWARCSLFVPGGRKEQEICRTSQAGRRPHGFAGRTTPCEDHRLVSACDCMRQPPRNRRPRRPKRPSAHEQADMAAGIAFFKSTSR